MQDCIKGIRLWMKHDKLLLNDEKTEFLIIGTRQQLSKVNISLITVGNSDVMRSSVVRNLGVFVDDKLSIKSHITATAYFMDCHRHKLIRYKEFKMQLQD